MHLLEQKYIQVHIHTQHSLSEVLLCDESQAKFKVVIVVAIFQICLDIPSLDIRLSEDI